MNREPKTWVLALMAGSMGLGIACSEPAALPAAAPHERGDRQADPAGGTDASAPPDTGAAADPECEPSERSGITLAGLLAEMVDLSHLTALPEPPYTAHLKSSHNPISDRATPGDAAWHADQDFIRPGDGNTVTLLDVRGPGVLTRIWSASPSGTLRVYLDGAQEPAIEAELAALLRGDVEPFRSPFAFIAAYGHNLYFPIAYAERCRVTLTGRGDGVVYYHIGYRTYPEDVVLEPYGDEALEAARCVREHVAARLRARSVASPDEAGESARFTLSSADGEARDARIDAPEGGGVVRELRLLPEQTAPDLLRATVLAIEMDGERTVYAPLLDFFALGFDAAVVASLPVSSDADGVLSARWPMPFQRTARIWLEHTGDGALEAELHVTHAPAAFTARSLYFYAGWHPPRLERSKPAHDIVLAEAEGAGYYVGNTLNVANPSAGWWGEGDERVYVDGETFPSHFGTGTEDYYGYAWCSNDLFSAPYIGQTASTSHQSFGLASLYRFQILDPIPFTRSLRFDLEVRHWGDPVDVSYDSMSVWYARPGARISGAHAATADFRLPALELDPPDGVAPGPYRCGG